MRAARRAARTWGAAGRTWYVPPVVLGSAFRDELASAGRVPIVEDERALEALLEKLVARGRCEHHTLLLEPTSFVRHLACCAARLGLGSSGGLTALYIEDLYLACAGMRGVVGAAEAFDRRCGRRLRTALAASARSAELRTEIAQRTRVLLLVGEADGRPKIASYSGQGPLDHFVAVVAQRLVFRAARSDTGELRAREGAAMEAVAAALHPEVSYVRDRYRSQFESALREALAMLNERDRLLLRLYLVSGVSLSEIGKMYGVNQSTASRWLAHARDAVAAELRRLMRERLGVVGDELWSLALLVASQLDVSISRVLAD